MNIIWKVFFTFIIVIVGAGAGAAIPQFFDAVFHPGEAELYTWLWTVFVSLLAVLPAWYIWKGTKLIPLLTNLIVRIMIMITIFLILPFLAGIFGKWETIQWAISVIDMIAIVGLGLIGLWLKS